MNFSDIQKKQLRKLSADTLRELGQEFGVVVRGRSKEEIINALEEHLTPENVHMVDVFILRYRFNGKGNVHFFSVDIDPALGLNNEVTTTAVLNQKLGANPFAVRLQPIVTESPTIIYAEFLTDERLLIETAHLGATRVLSSGWEDVEITPTIIARTIIHLNTGILQVHAANTAAKAIANVVSEELQIQNRPSAVIFSLQEIESIKNSIGAISTGNDVKWQAGEMDLSKHRGKGNADLDSDPDYIQASRGKVVRKKILQFNFEQETTRIELTVGKGTVNFKTLVGERIVNHVLAIIRQVKQLP